MKFYVVVAALVLPPVACAGVPVIPLAPAQIAAAGIVAAPPRSIDHIPARRGYGMVVDPAPALALHELIVEAEAGQRLADATMARTRTLFGGAGNVSKASLQQAEAQAAVAQARLVGLQAEARAKFGAVLGTALIKGGAPLEALARGDALVEVSVPGAALGVPPRAASAPHGVVLRLIGPAGHVPPGLVGETLYYTGPDLPVGLPLAVRLPVGGARRGVMVPANAVIYHADGASVYIEIAPGRFKSIGISLGETIDRHDGLAGYFVPDGVLPPGVKLVVRGAGVLRSIDKSAAQKSAGDPDGD
ncbi:MAG: hypothetical protein PHT60_02015 [Acidiphilium sp.]|nr:hypothetical protein [Acidiphilium sp.]MDD4934532.1 hypothetical protein [Acidiphilium sp.]